LSNPTSIFNKLSFFAPRQSGYETYLRSRLIGMPPTTLSQNEPDAKFVEWLLANVKNKDHSSNTILDLGKGTKKNVELWKKQLDENPHNFDLMTRNRLKRDNGGRGIGFHQCYWNPVSCFR
jgi:hypothetical protein